MLGVSPRTIRNWEKKDKKLAYYAYKGVRIEWLNAE